MKLLLKKLNLILLLLLINVLLNKTLAQSLKDSTAKSDSVLAYSLLQKATEIETALTRCDFLQMKYQSLRQNAISIAFAFNREATRRRESDLIIRNLQSAVNKTPKIRIKSFLTGLLIGSVGTTVYLLSR